MNALMILLQVILVTTTVSLPGHDWKSSYAPALISIAGKIIKRWFFFISLFLFTI